MCGSSSVSASEAVAVDIVEQRHTTAVGSGKNVTKSMMSNVKIPHIDHSTICRCRKGWEINLARSRVNITQFEFAVSHSDLKKLKDHISMCRGAEKPVRHGGMNVGNEAIPGMVYVGGVVRKRGSRFPLQNTTKKSFLNKFDVWVMVRKVGLKCSEFEVVSDSEGIP